MKVLDKYMAAKALKEMKDILDDMGIEFFLIYGTLLGAVRDGGFVETDTDIDLGVKHENLIPKIKELQQRLKDEGWMCVGFSYPYNFTRALNCWKYDTLIDIRNFEEWDGVRFLQRVDHNRVDIANVWPRELFQELKEIDFYNLKVKIPNPAEKWLEINYGKDWRTPDPDFHRSICGVENWWTKIGRKFLVHDTAK